MSLIQIREKGQITIPSRIRKELGIRKGDYLEIVKEDDKIVITPKILVDKVSVNLFVGKRWRDAKRGYRWCQER